jgi:Relaxase/Mobilisation nuclease domain
VIANQLKNRSFRSTLDYVLEKEEAEIIDSNMGGYNSRQLAKEFSAARRMRPKFQRACGHIILSIPHRDASHPQGEYHEHLDDEKYTDIAQRWLKAMKFLGDDLHKSQYVIARHHDTNHEHIHIIASRIRMDGSVVPDSWDYRRSEVVVRQLEKEFGLEQVPCSNEQVAQKVQEISGIDTTVCDTPVGSRYRDRRAQTKKQRHHFSGKPPVTQLLADAIDAATKDKPTVTELIARLQQQDIAVHPSFSTQGKFKEAVAYSLDGVKVAGWKLGKAYSFPGLLQRRGVDYKPERDMPALRTAQLGLLVKLSAPHKKVDDGFRNFNEINQQQVFDNEFNNWNQQNQQFFDNELSAIQENSQQNKNNKLSAEHSNNQQQDKDNKTTISQRANQQKSKDDKAIVVQITDQQLVKENKPTAAQETNYIQNEYATKIAPTIQLFWQMQKQPQRIEGNHYSITLEENILTLTRKSGEKIAALSVDNSSPPQGFSLTESDLERFLDLQRILAERIELQKRQKNREIEY